MGKEEIERCPFEHDEDPAEQLGKQIYSGSYSEDPLKIEFRTAWEDAFDVFEPVPTKLANPDWFKKLRVYVNPANEAWMMTGKACPSITDIFNTGYIIRTNKTVLVTQTPIPENYNEPYEDDPDFECDWCDNNLSDEAPDAQHIRDHHNHAQAGCAWVIKDDKVNDMKELLRESDQVEQHMMMETDEGKELIDWRYEITGGHNGGQVLGSSFDKKISVKFRQPWTIRTPEGTSCYWLDPMLQQNPYFAVMSGIIDTDKFNQIDTNCITIFYPKYDGNFIIPKGTPLVQIVPFVRTQWEHELVFEEDAILDHMKDKKLGLFGANAKTRTEKAVYRKHMWEAKKFK